MFAFLYLPILVMVVFAFNKPSAAAVADLPRDQRLRSSRPTRSATSRSGTGSPPAGSAPVCTTRRTSRRSSPACEIAAGGGDHRHRARACAPRSPSARMKRVLARAVRRARLPDPRRAGDRHRRGVPHLLRAGAQLRARRSRAWASGTILLGQIVFNASLAMLIIRARFVGMGDVLEEAVLRSRAPGRLSTFRQVTLPRLMPAIVAATLLSFTFSFDDYVVPGVHQRHDEHLADRALLGRPLRHHAGRQRPGHDDARRHGRSRWSSPLSSCAAAGRGEAPARSRRAAWMPRWACVRPR